MSSTRIKSIDALRAVAICFMVICHGTIYLSSPEIPAGMPKPDSYLIQAWIHFFGNHLVGDFAAPLFTFLVGISLAISFSSRNSLTEISSPRNSYQRGVSLLLIGWVYAILARGLKGFFGWDVLPFIGVSLLCLTALRKLSSRNLALIGIALIIASPFFRQWIHYQQFWGHEFGDIPGMHELLPGFLIDPLSYGNYHEYSLWRIMRAALFTGAFPLFPWLVFPLSGFILGREYFVRKTRQFRKLSSLTVVSLGLILSGITLAAVSLPSGAQALNSLLITPLSFYPDTTSMVCS